MGCKNSRVTSNQVTEENAKSNALDGNKNCPKENEITADIENTGRAPMCKSESEVDLKTVELTERQKELILDTWNMLVDNIASVGVITFMKLFETHPDVQDVFMPFKGMSAEELRHSKQLRAHGLRVMGFVQKVVARIDEPDKSQQLLKELGKSHVRYGAKVEYVDLIGPQFVYAVKPPLEEKWTDEIEEAWIQLFAYISHIMKIAMVKEIGGVESNKSPSTTKDNSEGNATNE